MNVLADHQELFYRSCSSRPFELCLWVEDGRGRGDQGDKSCHPNLSERLVLCGFIPLRVRESAMLSKHISGHLMAQWALLGWALLVNTTVPSAGLAQNRIISPSRFLSGQSLASRRLSHGHTQKKKLLNELKKIRVNFSTKFNYIFPPKSNLFEMTCCNLVV